MNQLFGTFIALAVGSTFLFAVACVIGLTVWSLWFISGKSRRQQGQEISERVYSGVTEGITKVSQMADNFIEMTKPK